MNGSAIASTKTFILDLKVRLRSYARRIEMDRAVLYAILARTWGLAAGPVSALLIAFKFTPTIQGFYYTFGSILALQTFAVLGIGFAIIQFASHEWAKLRIGEDRRIKGDPNALSRLASLAAGDLVDRRVDLAPEVLRGRRQLRRERAAGLLCERLRVAVDGEEVGHYSADGIIVATPTGSTAYSLSAGGPIVVPGVDAIVITAICPHTLGVRPLVVPGERVVMVEPLPPYSDEMIVSFDGQASVKLEPGSRLLVRRGERRVHLVRLGPEGYFARMRKKLQWRDLSDRDRR